MFARLKGAVQCLWMMTLSICVHPMTVFIYTIFLAKILKDTWRRRRLIKKRTELLKKMDVEDYATRVPQHEQKQMQNMLDRLNTDIWDIDAMLESIEEEF